MIVIVGTHIRELDKMATFFLIIIGILLPLVMHFVTKAAYQNGVTDGYGYSKEPRNPGYQEAGRYLRSTMYHRWSELRDKE